MARTVATSDLAKAIEQKTGSVPELLRGRYNVLRMVLATVLLAAAGLKAFQLASGPVSGDGARWLSIANVEFELFLGVWLLTGVLPKPAWAITVVCFTVFTCISLCKALLGADTCGCFGGASINPWFTTIFDLSIVVLLLRWRPRSEAWFIRADRLFMQVAWPVAIWMLVGLPAAYAMNSYVDTTISSAGEIVGDGDVVVIKGESWVGTRFPLLDYTNIGDRLSSGLWIVLLHRHTCSACREAVSAYTELAREFGTRANCPRVALIECPPYDRNAAPVGDDVVITGHLEGTHEWQLLAPMSVLVDNGVVKGVFTTTKDLALLRSIWGDEKT